MKTPATHNGTCQVCGRLQAFAGTVAKHGYTIPHGYFQGVCPGSDHDALENDRAFADEVAKSLREQAQHEVEFVSRIDAGEVKPDQAKSGKQEQYDRVDSFGRAHKSWRDQMVAFADAPAHHQLQAVAALRRHHEAQGELAARVANDIVARADKITGKQALQARATEAAKKVIGPGTVVSLGGKDGITVTVLRVEDRTAWGVGPYLNGNVMPHIVYDLNGKERAYPVRLIRQAAIK